MPVEDCVEEQQLDEWESLERLLDVTKERKRFEDGIPQTSAINQQFEE